MQKPLKIAMISDYGVNCGIATYTKYLCDGMRQQVNDLRIFAEHAEPSALLNDKKDNVIRCWKRNEDYTELIEQIRLYNPDIVFIQHEYGLFHKMNEWGSLLTRLGNFRVIVCLHTVLEHDVANPQRRAEYTSKIIAEAQCPEVIVHSRRARQTLRNRGYGGLIHYIPHGSFPPKFEKLPATKYGMYPEHSIFQYGFGGKYKGWDLGLDIVEKLKTKYPDVMYIGLYNVNDKGRGEQSTLYFDLITQIEQRNLHNNVAIIKGYQNDTMIANFVKSSKVAIFPYQKPNPDWASWGASGAIQLPMSLGVPMVLSDYPAFLEYTGLLPICSKLEDYVAVIDRIFSDSQYERNLQQRAVEICASRTWAKCADWYLNCPPTEDFDAPVLFS